MLSKENMDNMTMMLVESLLMFNYNITPDTIVGAYHYGSSTYGTQTDTSDSDFVIIVDMKDDYIQYESDNVDMHILSIDYYKKLLNDHDIMSLEVYFNPYPIKSFETDFELDKVKLRHKISSVISNSWVKAKKKVTLENEDSYIGIKSCFHAIRIARMGTLIATKDKNIFPSSNITLWFNMLSDAIKCNYEWDLFSKIYKPVFNKAKTEFKKVAPKK